MGIKLIILLALLVGVLYSLHILVQDYQALSAPRLLKFLFKRDVSSVSQSKPTVRWRKILKFDPIQCARYLYCDIGAQPPNNALRQGFTFMLKLEPKLEDETAWRVFKEAYQFGKSLNWSQREKCRMKYSMCPFNASLLFDLINFLVHEHSQL